MIANGRQPLQRLEDSSDFAQYHALIFVFGCQCYAQFLSEKIHLLHRLLAGL